MGAAKFRENGSSPGDRRNVIFGTMFGRIIKRAGSVAWARAWHNLRSSRQTELTEISLSDFVSVWLGNSHRIAEKHSLRVFNSHFEKATNADWMRTCTQNGIKTISKASHDDQAGKKKAPENQGLTATYVGMRSSKMGDEGFDSSRDAMQKTENLSELYASLYARDAELGRLIDCWSRLTVEDRLAIAEQVELLAAGKTAMVAEMGATD